MGKIVASWEVQVISRWAGPFLSQISSNHLGSLWALTMSRVSALFKGSGDTP